MEIQEMIGILQHAGKGGVVEYFDWHTKKWTVALAPTWNFYGDNFRIKPEPKRVPLGYTDMLVGKCVVEKGRYERRLIISQDNSSVLLSESALNIGNQWYYYDKLMEYFNFSDGTPCSKESDCG